MNNLYTNNEYVDMFKKYDKVHLNTSFDMKSTNGFFKVISYLYSNGDNILLDYYRTKEVRDTINMSYSLLNYYHGIFYENINLLEKGVSQFVEKSSYYDAVSLIIGLTIYDSELIRILEKNDFILKRCSTAMIKELNETDKQDISISLLKKKRDNFRNIRKRYQDQNVQCKVGKLDFETIDNLFDETLKEKDPNRELIPKNFMNEIIKNLNVNIFVAEINQKSIGVLIGIKQDEDYYILFSAHDGKSHLKTYYTSYALFEVAINYAANNECKRVHAGRDPYLFKRNLGFKEIPIYWAGKGSSDIQQEKIYDWLTFLEKRHLTKYEKEFSKK